MYSYVFYEHIRRYYTESIASPLFEEIDHVFGSTNPILFNHIIFTLRNEQTNNT